LYTNQWLRPDDALFKKPIPHCLIDTWGAQLVDALHRAPDDLIVRKRRYSAFFGTDLDLLLREHTITTVIITGVVTNICVRSTVHDAFFLGYGVMCPSNV
jgi:ureidoacrylate peracid hydrolase